MARKVIGEGWKAYLGGLRQVRRDNRAAAATSPGGYPYSVPGPQRNLTSRARETTGELAERN